MDFTTIEGTAAGAVSLPYSAPMAMLRKTLDVASQEGRQLLSTVAQDTGLGTVLDITA